MLPCCLHFGFRGEIPTDLSNCRSLVNLSLLENQLQGEIPSGFGNLQNLRNFFLYSNRLTGQLPTNFWKIPSLENVLVYNNYLSGELPSEMSELKQLRNVSLFNNGFSGVIPYELGVNSNLTQLDFTNNSFTGEIPPNLCLNKQLKRLNMGFNFLQGSIPPDVGLCSSLTRLILKENNLSGVVPFFVENKNLLYMNLGGNSLSGMIPSSLGNLSGITEIDFSMNKLTGVVSSELFGNMVNLGRLNISYNRLEGLLPSYQLSNCTELFDLDLSYNLFNGSIPSFAFRSLKKLSTLNLNGNKLVGGLPAFLLFEIDSLLNLQLGGNMLGGSFPSYEMEATQHHLKRLNVSWNGMTSEIKELGRLSELEELDISHNSLTGTLSYIGGTGPKLVKLNVSYNHFSGQIPETLLKVPNSFPYSFVGNSGLCLICLLPTINNSSCHENPILKSCSQKTPSSSTNSTTKIALIAIGSSVVLIIILVGCFMCFFQRKRKNRDDSNLVDEEEGASSELNRIMLATENLDDKYLIGKGAHGKVYKVSLPNPDHVKQEGVVHYAAKKLVFSGSIRKSMVREIETVGRVRHRNLVKLENFWLRKEYGLILYQYMENGSLHDVLQEISPPRNLEWNERYRIAIGVANGLSYLHHDCDPPIVHRDIKPMNILLDLDMEPHISDFGIAKLLLLDHDQSTAPIQSNAVLSTIGYIAPENAFSINNFSTKSDVYSFGVVLLELITRKKLHGISHHFASCVGRHHDCCRRLGGVEESSFPQSRQRDFGPHY
ncbi:receptor-like protein kinase isoform X1 [Impatiens glandulifera]|uniref:receptor-like protein kinase isoform X1 n=1 Tax=Impatiens glandulifera TaxID=253017 RepID=UPI001FB17BB8|nr:receptor-like protein kinase isoform X1 [Impatiens glandulifera]